MNAPVALYHWTRTCLGSALFVVMLIGTDVLLATGIVFGLVASEHSSPA
ncbi:hypothetical protein SUDANB145_02840 [Streptomyces sp. enrichment culture]